MFQLLKDLVSGAAAFFRFSEKKQELANTPEMQDNARARQDEWHPRRGIEGTQFRPQPAVIAEVKAVVADQDNHGVSPEFQTVELVEQHPDMSIGEGDTRVITPDRGLAGLPDAAPSQRHRRLKP